MAEVGDDAEHHPATCERRPVPARHVDLVGHLPAAMLDVVQREAGLGCRDVLTHDGVSFTFRSGK
jgi:hypothetical protein